MTPCNLFYKNEMKIAKVEFYKWQRGLFNVKCRPPSHEQSQHQLRRWPLKRWLFLKGLQVVMVCKLKFCSKITIKRDVRLLYAFNISDLVNRFIRATRRHYNDGIKKK